MSRLSYQHIRYWLRECFWWRATYIPRRIGHIASWVPLLWNDRDYDHTYLYEMMREKIHRMKILHNNSSRYKGWKKIVNELTRTEEALGRLIIDDYGAELREVHKKKFGNWITKYGIKKMKDGEMDNMHSIWRKEKAMRRADLKTVAMNIEKNSEGWWT